MKHFLRIGVTYRSIIVQYLRNSYYNKIGNFDCCVLYYDKSWRKDRHYRGGYKFSKAPHYESSDGNKRWYYKGMRYNSYEEYLMAMMG